MYRTKYDEVDNNHGKVEQDGNKVAVIPTPGQMEWIFIPDGNGKKKLITFGLSDLYNQNFTRGIYEVGMNRCLAAKRGWLVMEDSSKEGHFFLWKPDTEEILDLPSLNEDAFQGRVSCLLHSPPPDPDCMILFVDKRFFMSWRLGDEKWTKEEYTLIRNGNRTNDYISEAISCTDGNIYGLTEQYDVTVINREPSGLLSARFIDFERPQMLHGSACRAEAFVESCGDMLFVVIHYVGFHCKAVEHVEILKMDFFRGVWVKLDSLGHKSLFVLHDASTSFSATKLGLKGNCIYFNPLREDDNLYSFDLEDESLSYFPPRPSLRTSPFFPFLLMPHPGDRLVEKQLNKVEYTSTVEEEEPKTTESMMHSGTQVVKYLKGRQWIDLHTDVLCSIVPHLQSVVDYRNIRSVCKSWASSIPPIQWSVDLTGATIEYPWLMFCNRGKSRCSFVDPFCNTTTHCFEMAGLLDANICFSKDGWLLMKKGYFSMFFFNPFTKAIVELPDLPRIILGGISFSSPPTSSDCIVFGVCLAVYFATTVVFMHPGEDDWTMLRFEHRDAFFPSAINPVFYAGAFYCLGHKRKLGVFDLKEDGGADWSILRTPQPSSRVQQHYLVESNGELLLITTMRKGKYVHAYKLDRSNRYWKLVDHLEGGRMVFVGRSTCMSVKAMSEEMQNRIYFPFSFNDESRCVFYSLNTRRWNSAFGEYCQKDIYSRKENLHSTWIQPNLSWKQNICKMGLG